MFDWIGQYISLDPTASRWGVFAILFALSIFFLGGSGMIQRWSERHKMASKFLFGLGVLFVGLTIFVGILWIAQGSKDTTYADLQEIKGKVESIEDRLDSIDVTLEELIEGLENDSE